MKWIWLWWEMFLTTEINLNIKIIEKYNDVDRGADGVSDDFCYVRRSES